MAWNALVTIRHDNNTAHDSASCVAISQSTYGSPKGVFVTVEMVGCAPYGKWDGVLSRELLSGADFFCNAVRVGIAIYMENSVQSVTGKTFWCAQENVFEKVCWAHHQSISNLGCESTGNGYRDGTRDGFTMCMGWHGLGLCFLNQAFDIVSEECTEGSNAHGGAIAMGAFTAVGCGCYLL